ncbi:MAG: hypothetical protein NT027_12970 [Proteobacteria bacterium]|nr:hypothetical protein [Pseudomonadota bacterium]
MLKKLFVQTVLFMGIFSCGKDDDGPAKAAEPNSNQLAPVGGEPSTIDGIYNIFESRRSDVDCNTSIGEQRLPEKLFRKYRAGKQFEHAPDGGKLLDALSEAFCSSEEDCKKPSGWITAAKHYANKEWRGYNGLKMCFANKASTSVEVYRLTDSGLILRQEYWSVEVENCENYQEKMYEKRDQLRCRNFSEYHMKRVGDLIFESSQNRN